MGFIYISGTWRLKVKTAGRSMLWVTEKIGSRIMNRITVGILVPNAERKFGRLKLILIT